MGSAARRGLDDSLPAQALRSSGPTFLREVGPYGLTLTPGAGDPSTRLAEFILAARTAPRADVHVTTPVISAAGDRDDYGPEAVISSLSGNLVWKIPFERSLDTTRDDDREEISRHCSR